MYNSNKLKKICDEKGGKDNDWSLLKRQRKIMNVKFFKYLHVVNNRFERVEMKFM